MGQHKGSTWNGNAPWNSFVEAVVDVKFNTEL